jgi:hypothetical protein
MSAASSIAAGSLNTVGKSIRIRSSGSFAVNANGNVVNLSVKLDTAGFGTASAYSATVTVTQYTWSMDLTYTTVTTGVTGTMVLAGQFVIGSTGSGATGVTAGVYPQTGTITLDLTAARLPVNGVAMSNASTGNTATQNVMLVEQLN